MVLFRDVLGKMDELLGLGFRCSFPPLRTPFPHPVPPDRTIYHLK